MDDKHNAPDVDQTTYDLAVKGLQDCVYYSHFAVWKKGEMTHARQAREDIQAKVKYIAESLLANPHLFDSFETVSEAVEQIRDGRVFGTGLRGTFGPKNIIGFIEPIAALREARL